MAQHTDFGKQVRHRLIDLEKNQAWLIEEVRKRTGLYMDNSYMSKILNGECASQNITSAIKEILNMEEAKT